MYRSGKRGFGWRSLEANSPLAGWTVGSDDAAVRLGGVWLSSSRRWKGDRRERRLGRFLCGVGVTVVIEVGDMAAGMVPRFADTTGRYADRGDKSTPSGVRTVRLSSARRRGGIAGKVKLYRVQAMVAGPAKGRMTGMRVQVLMVSQALAPSLTGWIR